MDAQQALLNSRENKNRATTKYFREFDGFADIDFSPKFSLNSETRFFTIGSCFARNIENYLENKKIPLLSKMPRVSGDYFKAGGADRSGYQNVYTPGSVLEVSRLLTSDDPFHSIVEQKGEYYDLLTHGLRGLPKETAMDIRKGFIATYENLKHTDVLIVTLGYIEAWLYKKTSAWVNQSPADAKLRGLSDNFVLEILSFDRVYEILNEALANFRKINPAIRFIFTVSPVPLGSTFSTDHILVANQRSKSTLHAVVQKLWSENDDLDYFPSYEMVSLSDREVAFEDDFIHVKASAVSKVMNRFFSCYFPQQ